LIDLCVCVCVSICADADLTAYKRTLIYVANALRQQAAAAEASDQCKSRALAPSRSVNWRLAEA